MRLNTRGQALAEFAIVALLSFGALSAMGILFTTEWTRWRCSREVFEATRAALVARPWRPKVMVQVSVTGPLDSPKSYEGFAQCGRLHDQISIPTLSERIGAL